MVEPTVLNPFWPLLAWKKEIGMGRAKEYDAIFAQSFSFSPGMCLAIS